MPHKHVPLSQTGFQGVQHDDYEHVKIQRLYERLPTEKSHHLLAAVSTITQGEPLPVHYHGPAVMYIIEGELHVKDKSKPDKVTKLFAGDVLHIDNGSNIIYTTPNKAKTFATSYAPTNLHAEDYVVKK